GTPSLATLAFLRRISGRLYPSSIGGGSGKRCRLITNLGISISNPFPCAPDPGVEPFPLVGQPLFLPPAEEVRKLVRLITIYRGILFYGDSGVGKSSLISAGLVPALIDDGFRPERMRVQPVAGNEVLIERIPLTDECEPPFLDSNFAQPISA